MYSDSQNLHKSFEAGFYHVVYNCNHADNQNAVVNNNSAAANKGGGLPHLPSWIPVC